LRLWDAYRAAHEDMTQSQLRKWCERSFLGFLRMREWRELHRQLKLQCEELWGRAALDSPSAGSSSAGTRGPGNGKRGKDSLPAPVRNRRRRQEPAVVEEDAGGVRLSAAAHGALHRALTAGPP